MYASTDTRYPVAHALRLVLYSEDMNESCYLPRTFVLHAPLQLDNHNFAG